MEFMDTVKARKSVRSYSSKMVEAEKLRGILEAARIAPSWANRQCWSFIVVTDREKIRKLAGGLINPWLKYAPVVIVACGNPKKSGSRNGMDYYLVDVAIAMEHLILAAADFGLGTCWIGGFDEKKVKSILGVPDNIKIVALTPVGYPAGEGVRDKLVKKLVNSRKRKPMDEILHKNMW